MKKWYYFKMMEADLLSEAKNYAQMAGIDIGELIRLRYLVG
jgi:hypothetical protein